MLSSVLPLATCSYLKLNLTNLELSLSVMLAIFQVLNSQMWLVATLLNNADREHLHHCKSSPGNTALDVWYLQLGLVLKRTGCYIW